MTPRRRYIDLDKGNVSIECPRFMPNWPTRWPSSCVHEEVVIDCLGLDPPHCRPALICDAAS
jgi:hypothetical protein